MADAVTRHVQSAGLDLVIRPCVPMRADYQAVVAIHNAIFPDTPAAVEDYEEHDARCGPPYKTGRLLAAVDGQVVGMALYAQYAWSYHPQRFYVTVQVMPGWWRRGIGGALYDALLTDLEPFNPAELCCPVREDQADGLDFVARRGYAETFRIAESRLDVRTFDPTPYADLEAELAARGIVIKTLRELAPDPDRDRKLYDLDWELGQDVPGAEIFTRVPFEKWRAETIGAETLLPDAYFIATHGQQYIGMSDLWAERASDMLDTGSTGTRRDYRGLGVATAMKVRGICWAQVNGKSFIKTGNAADNQAMRSINRRLGFVKQPDHIDHRLTLRDLAKDG
ncbi:MAG: GNAT family N-acetyltransferase [Anaerolineae bacterium]|nr:GNAT family N-acetyltransferase [Anaerolineae bacterium]